MQKFRDRLDEAERVLTKAHELDPSDGRAASLMIIVKMGQGAGGGGRAAMEEWFTRAVDASPDDVDACARKLRYLSPRWHGSDADVLAFGRECLRGQNYRGGVALFVLDAHAAVAAAGTDTKEYYARPEVWADVREAFEGHLVNFPRDDRRRSAYARFACLAGRWDVAAAQFAALGDRAAADVFEGRATLDYYRRKAARLAGEK